MKKKIKMHEKKESKNKREDAVPEGAVPAYLLDRYACHVMVMWPFQIILKYPQRGPVSCKSAEQHDQTEEKREGCKW